MKAAPVKYAVPETVEEAVTLLADHGAGAKVLAGGQSLLALMNLRMANPEVLVDVRRCGLEGIDVNGALRIGATTTQNAVLASAQVREACPLLSRALREVGHHALRNRGTVGGSVAHADPAAEIPAVLVALRGEVEARGQDGIRTIAAEEFFISHFTTMLDDAEVLTEVRFRPADAWAFYEISRRHGDYALVGVAASFDLGSADEVATARIVLFSVGERPVRATGAEAAIVGHPLSDQAAIESAGRAAAAGIEPAGDIHGSTRYRRRLIDVAVRRALTAATSTRSVV